MTQEEKGEIIMIKKIYRAEIWGSQDSCSEVWDFIPLGSFHTKREGAEKDIEEFKGLNGIELEVAICKKLDVYAYFANNKPHVEVYVLIED